MTAPIISSAAPVKLNSTVLAATNIGLPTAIAQEAFQHSGNLFPSVVAVSGAIPRVTFQTPLKDALATIGTTQLALTTFELYLALFSASTYAKLGSSSHPKWATSTACAYITGWSVNHGGIAMASVEVIPLSADGSTHPLTRTNSTTLPSLGSEPLLHTMGPLSVNGTVITGMDSVSVQLNPTITPLVTDGDLYPRTVAYLAGVPSITGEHKDPSTLNTALGWIGAPISANVIQYFKSFDATTQLVSTANSVSATIASGRINISEFSETQSAVARSQIYIAPLSSSSTHPIAISTSATAPTT